MKFGPGPFMLRDPSAADETVPGVSERPDGYEVHVRGKVTWFDDLLVALATCRRAGGGTVVRCTDRALLSKVVTSSRRTGE